MSKKRLLEKRMFIYKTLNAVIAQNARPLHQCLYGTSSEWIVGHVQKPVVYLQSSLQRLLYIFATRSISDCTDVS